MNSIIFHLNKVVPHKVSCCLPFLLCVLWRPRFLICSIFGNCLFRCPRTKAVQHRVYYKYSFRPTWSVLFSMMTLPCWLWSTPWWIISRAWAAGGKQKYKNHCAHCPPFEKKHPGKSPGERKNHNSGRWNNYLRVSAALSWNLSVGTMFGLWPTVAALITSKQGPEADLPSRTSGAIPGQQTNKNLHKLTAWTMTPNPNCVRKTPSIYQRRFDRSSLVGNGLQL